MLGCDDGACTSDLLGLTVYDSDSGGWDACAKSRWFPRTTRPVSPPSLCAPARGPDCRHRSAAPVNGGVHTSARSADLPKYSSGEGMLLLERDLLDQQIIDVHGRKVVRVNDIELALDRESVGSGLPCASPLSMPVPGARSAVCSRACCRAMRYPVGWSASHRVTFPGSPST